MILISILVSLTIISYSQTTSEYYQQYELNRTYWNYRDRFKKQFIYLGTKPGDGYPMSERLQDYCEGGSTRIQFGDCLASFDCCI
jgi:hypothetical protein